MRGEYFPPYGRLKLSLGSPPLARGILYCDSSLSRNSGSPPLARGILRSVCFVRLPSRITPACAGNTSRNFLYGHMSMDHPRLRGEYLSSILSLSLFVGSPPLARGIPTVRFLVGFCSGITPACAGNTCQYITPSY